MNIIQQSEPHPVIGMTHGRAEIWKKKAIDEDFMKQLQDLSSIYSDRKREEYFKETGEHQPLDSLKLLKDYKIWLEKNG